MSYGYPSYTGSTYGYGGGYVPSNNIKCYTCLAMGQECSPDANNPQGACTYCTANGILANTCSLITSGSPIKQTTTPNPTQQFGGANPYGAAGTVKCEQCRNRRKKCEYDQSRPDLPCTYCANHNLAATCIKVQSQGATNNQATNVQTSAPTTKVSEYATYYEQLYPTATPQQILAYLNQAFQGSGQQSPSLNAANTSGYFYGAT